MYFYKSDDFDEENRNDYTEREVHRRRQRLMT